MPLVDRVEIAVELYDVVCQLYLRRWNMTGDVKALWSQSIYRCVLLHIVGTLY